MRGDWASGCAGRFRQPAEMKGSSQPSGAGTGTSSRVLFESEPYSFDGRIYERQRVLLDAVGEVRAGRRISRRVVNIWTYQQHEQCSRAG